MGAGGPSMGGNSQGTGCFGIVTSWSWGRLSAQCPPTDRVHWGLHLGHSVEEEAQSYQDLGGIWEAPGQNTGPSLSPQP